MSMCSLAHSQVGIALAHPQEHNRGPSSRDPSGRCKGALLAEKALCLDKRE